MADKQPLRAHLEPRPDKAEGRRHPRRALRLETIGELPSGIEANVTVHNMSVAGLLIETEIPLSVGDILAVGLPDIGPVGAEVVWESGRLFGCAFEQALGEAALAAAQLQGQFLGDRSSPTPAAPQTAVSPGLPTHDPLAVKLNRLRRERGLTLEQVAAELSVSKPTVWAWEKGKARPLPERYAAIAQALGVDEEELTQSTAPGSESAIVEDCRQRLASAYRVPTNKIRIMIDL